MPAITKYVEIFRDWDSIKNDMDKSIVPIHGKTAYWWTCEKGHSYQVSVFSRIRSGGCKVCNTPQKAKKIREARLVNSTSFAEEYPELAKNWDFTKNKIKPTEISKKSNVKVWFRCEKGTRI